MSNSISSVPARPRAEEFIVIPTTDANVALYRSGMVRHVICNRPNLGNSAKIRLNPEMIR